MMCETEAVNDPKGDPKGDSKGVGPKDGWNVFVSDVPYSDLFTCAMTHPNVEHMSDANKNTIYRLCEVFQSAVQSVAITTNRGGSLISIKVINLQDPETDNLLWSKIHTLVDQDSKSFVEIHSLNHEGEDISIERYMVGDIEMKLTRSYTKSRETQAIEIIGTIIGEFIAE